MKKLISLALLASISYAANAADLGSVETYDFDSFKLHIYNTHDVMADTSYIIEGKDSLVTMEQPLFKANVAEFDDYLAKLNKKVEKRISDYHLGGTFAEPLVMPEGMDKFVKGPVYSGMMQHFAQVFGDTIVAEPTGAVETVPFHTHEKWAGVDFVFHPGASSDFPAASIVIGDKVYYTHWAFSKAHLNPLQISSRAAVKAELEEAQKALASNAELFIGGHGGVATRDLVEFRVQYLSNLESLLNQYKNPNSVVNALLERYPILPGAEGLSDAVKKFY